MSMYVICRSAGCNRTVKKTELMRKSDYYCFIHKKENSNEARERLNSLNKSNKFSRYDSDWKKKAKGFLKVHTNCSACGEKASEVHHIKQKSEGGSDEYDNLVAMCKPCHRDITKELSRVNKNFKVDRDGNVIKKGCAA